MILSATILSSLIGLWAPAGIQVHELSPEALGMAGSFVSVADDSSNFYQNPAGLGRIVGKRRVSSDVRFKEKFKEFGVHVSLMDGKTQEPLAWGFAFNTARTDYEKFYDYAVASSFSFMRMFHFGAQTSFTNFNTAEVTDDRWIISGDLGGLALFGDHVSIGMSGKNIWRSKKKGSLAPVSASGGAGINFFRWRASIEGERDFSNKIWSGRVGGEFRVFEEFVVRAGYATNYKGEILDKAYTLGVSIRAGNMFSIAGAFMDVLNSSERAVSSGLQFSF